MAALLGKDDAWVFRQNRLIDLQRLPPAFRGLETLRPITLTGDPGNTPLLLGASYALDRFTGTGANPRCFTERGDRILVPSR